MLGAAGIGCRIENEAGLLPKEVDGVLAWTVREGTTNVIRHSRAHNCRIVLTREDGRVYAEITDDGQGKTEERASGSGLSGLAERIAGFGDGEFEAEPLQDGGFRLRVDLPLSKSAAR
jgi:two-component system sensor histidine kinase DesK